MKLIINGIHKDDLTHYYNLPFIACKETKLRAFQFKILHNILPTKYFLYKIKIAKDNQCFACHSVQTLEHLFYHCPLSVNFWNDLSVWAKKCVSLKEKLSVTDVLYGHRPKDKQFISFNQIIITAKYFIFTQNLKEEPFYF
jgi:hypothetical protein